MSITEQPIKNPTWMADIRFFFTDDDKNHMARRGIDLATYEGVKEKALRVLGATEPPDATMPPDPAPKWSQARWDTFKNWIVNGYPHGTAVPQQVSLLAESTASRVRKNVADLGQDELKALKVAFDGIMKLPPDDPNSYFAQAAVHWRPEPLYCLHHENRYNPWHRAYLYPFENALRSIPGCENVTLPYWDISTLIPDFLYKPPFDKYTLPRDIGGGYPQGYVTTRYSAAQVKENVEKYDIPNQIIQAMSKSVWSEFNSGIIRAHDNGHVSIGPTLSQQDVASYDPIFWLFHANLDRLWWKWQQTLRATTLNGFLSTVRGSTDWLKSPFNGLPPFKDTADATIDLSAKYDVDYKHPSTEKQAPLMSESFGSLPAAALHGLHSADKAEVRVKGIDRLNIPGSFVLHLQANGTTIARQAFFQSQNPRSCTACVKQGKINIDLEVELDQLRGAQLRVVIEPMWPNPMGSTFPLSSAGDPTINIRLLLE